MSYCAKLQLKVRDLEKSVVMDVKRFSEKEKSYFSNSLAEATSEIKPMMTKPVFNNESESKEMSKKKNLPSPIENTLTPTKVGVTDKGYSKSEKDDSGDDDDDDDSGNIMF